MLVLFVVEEVGDAASPGGWRVNRCAAAVGRGRNYGCRAGAVGSDDRGGGSETQSYRDERASGILAEEGKLRLFVFLGLMRMMLMMLRRLVAEVGDHVARIAGRGPGLVFSVASGGGGGHRRMQCSGLLLLAVSIQQN